MKRFCILTLWILSAVISCAQQSADEKINKAFNICFSDIEAAKHIINTINETELLSLPDSTSFDYHYVCAGISSAEQDNERTIFHLLETKRLCETSIGIRQTVYLEIMNALASAYKDNGDLDNALAIYQEAIIKGLSIRNRKGAKEEFGNLNSGLASVYEEKGWQKEVPSMWRNAWNYWNKKDSFFETYNIFPLFMLSDYHERKGEYHIALEINKEMSDYTLTQTDKNNPVWCDIFYQKGSILGHQGKYEEAVKAYKEGLFVAKENGIKDEKAEQLYGNMICCLSEYGSYQSIDTALSELHTYFPKVYSQTLFSLSSVFEKNKRYKDAIEYINRAIPLVKGNVKEQYEWYKNLYSHEYDNQQQLSLLLKTPIHDEGTNDWFIHMEKLANAYYLDKNKEMAKEVLEQIVTVSIRKRQSDSEQSRFIKMLISCAADVNDYITVLKYSKIRIDYDKNKFGKQSKEYYASLNTEAIAYIKTNDHKRAHSILEICTPICITLFGKESEQYATLLHNKGRVAQLAGDLKSAKAYYEESLSVHSLAKTPASRTLRTREYLGKVELSLKEQL